MPYLYCKEDGLRHEANSAAHQEEYREIGESVLIVKGRLISGPWRCDSCNAVLKKGDLAHFHAAYPADCRDYLYDYDFAYEQEYFAMKRSDKAVVYGAPWPDDSISNRRLASPQERKRRSEQPRPLCALDLFGIDDD
jgi:hypothetical protein